MVMGVLSTLGILDTSPLLQPAKKTRPIAAGLLAFALNICHAPAHSFHFYWPTVRSGLCYRKSVRPSVTLVDCGQTAFPRGDRFHCSYREGQKASYAVCKPLFLAVAEI